jgi:tripartite-type tricarboxylate transporter receptor subunit TctC
MSDCNAMRWFVACPAILALGLSAPLLAQQTQSAFPTKTVRVVVGFPPGGPVDSVGRIFASRLGVAFGQQVVVDNRPGANSILAAEFVAKSPPDGYTLLLASAGVVTVHPHLYPKLSYQPLRDFAPITILATAPLVLAAHPSLPAKTIKELIGLARARPGALNYASSGSGGAPHLAGELFKSLARVDIAHIPYKGVAPALTDVLGGQVSLLFSNTVSVLPHVQAGKVRALGVTSASRSAAAPQIPTIAESGVPGYEVTTWQGILAPAGTPNAVVMRLAAEFVRVAHSAEVKERLAREGSEAVGNSPEDFREVIRTESERWARVVREARIRAE